MSSEQDQQYQQPPTIITLGIIIICSLVFIWQLTTGLPERYISYGFGVTPGLLFNQHPTLIHPFPVWLTIFSSMFLHGSWLHLIGNMFYLWVFGRTIEDRIGHIRFLVFYLLCGVIAVFSHALLDIQSMIPMIGASGAISGILGAYLILYPQSRVLIILPLIVVFYSYWVPAWIVLLIWFVWQVAAAFIYDAQQSGIAWAAHIGGFIAGMVFIWLFTPAQQQKPN